MESMGMTSLFDDIYKNKTVLVTGHTGFKGSWLVYWLKQMGANVVGYSLEAPTIPNHIDLLNLDIISIVGDIRDLNKLNETFETYKPDIVFHLAAQALVRLSYSSPIETYETNVIGTLKVFEASKKSSVKAIINITSDKAYENNESNTPYKESDSIGGYDPYSSSKGCSEILTNSYRNSYFNIKAYKKEHHTLLASCRAGNVIGGGDWAKDRLIPDIIKAINEKETVLIRNPNSIRPWQHVLEPLSGYLLIGQKLLEEKANFAQAWNFGPPVNETLNVEELVKLSQKYWSDLKYEITSDFPKLHEAILLQLDCTKANKELSWSNVWNNEDSIKRTVLWYKNFYIDKKLNTYNDFEQYVLEAKKKGFIWSKN